VNQTTLLPSSQHGSIYGSPAREARSKTALKWAVIFLCGILIGTSVAVQPYVALLAVMSILLLPWALRNIPLVILLLAVYTPFEEFVLKWLPETLASVLRFAPEAVIGLLLAALVLRNMSRGTLWKRTPIDLPVLLFVAFSGLSALANNVPVTVWVLGIREFARYILLYYLVVYAELSSRFLKLMIIALMAAAAFEASLGLLQAVLGNRFGALLAPEPVYVSETMVRSGFSQILSGSTRIFGTLGRYERFGIFTTAFLLLGLGLYLSLRRTLGRGMTLGFGAFALLLGPALALSFSRTSWFSLYAGTVVAFLLNRSKKIVALLLILPVLGTVGLLSWSVLEDWRVAKTEEASLVQRYTATFSPGYVNVLLSRGRLFSLLKVSPIILRDYTWLGLGPGTIGSTATGGGTKSPGLLPEYSHVDWLDVSEVGRAESLTLLHDVGWASILAQMGVLGLLAFVWVVVELGVVAFRCYVTSSDRFLRGFSLGYVALLAAVVLANFAMFAFSYRGISMYVWLFGGMLAAYWRRLGDASPSSRLRPPDDGAPV
jgi:putative inorganic carbon (HCO3(-)) transporter